jgi:hypothetical protein
MFLYAYRTCSETTERQIEMSNPGDWQSFKLLQELKQQEIAAKSLRRAELGLREEPMPDLRGGVASFLHALAHRVDAATGECAPVSTNGEAIPS